jgi:hypothetical protein
MTDMHATYAQNLWQIANIIVGFSVAQLLVVLIGMATNPSFDSMVLQHKWIAAIVSTVIQPFLALFICYCHSEELVLLPLDRTVSKLITDVRDGQIATLIIVLFAVYILAFIPRSKKPTLELAL